ncbi:MAG: RidA family protein [Pseudomonadota bacterium]
MTGYGAQLTLSPGILSGGHIFVTGMTGSDSDGRMPADPETQFRAAFAKIATVLEEAGASLADVVEMTSYHVALARQFDFDQVRLDLLTEPYPAWTAVEVAGLRRDGALVEIRVIAQAP